MGRPGDPTALEHGKSVVTANKALLAQSTGELAQAAERPCGPVFRGRRRRGAIPVIRPLTQSLAGDTVLRVAASSMAPPTTSRADGSTGGLRRSAGRRQRPRLRAEADPTADVEGYDARGPGRHPGVIAFTPASPPTTSTARASPCHPADFESARALGCTIKLLSICRADRLRRWPGTGFGPGLPGAGAVDHPLATVSGAFNAVVVEAEASGRLMFHGPVCRRRRPRRR